MWVKFTADFDFVPVTKPQVTIAYAAGMVLNVPTAAGTKAVALGRAAKCKAPNRVRGA